MCVSNRNMNSKKRILSVISLYICIFYMIDFIDTYDSTLMSMSKYYKICKLNVLQSNKEFISIKYMTFLFYFYYNINFILGILKFLKVFLLLLFVLFIIGV